MWNWCHVKWRRANRIYVRITQQVTTVGWNCDGEKIVTGSTDQTLRTWDLATMKEEKELKGHKNRLNMAQWSPQLPHIVASVSSDNSLRIWDTRSAKVAHLLAIDAEPFLVAWSPDGGTICVGNTKEKLSFVDMKKCKVSTTLENSQQLYGFTWNCTGKRFLCAVKDTVKLLEWPSLAEVNVGRVQGKAHCVGAHPRESDIFVVGSSDTIVSYWEASEMICLGGYTSLESEVRSVAYNNTGQLVGLGGRSGDVSILDVEENEIKHSKNVPGRMYSLHVTWNPKRNILAHIGKQSAGRGGYRGIVSFLEDR